MVKKKYSSPVLMFQGLTPDDDPTIVNGNSVGTSGEDPRFEWDPSIDERDIEMFWLSYDETDLEETVDADGDFYISYNEFYAWLANNGGW